MYECYILQLSRSGEVTPIRGKGYISQYIRTNHERLNKIWKCWSDPFKPAESIIISSKGNLSGTGILKVSAPDVTCNWALHRMVKGNPSMQLPRVWLPLFQKTENVHWYASGITDMMRTRGQSAYFTIEWDSGQCHVPASVPKKREGHRSKRW